MTIVTTELKKGSAGNVKMIFGKSVISGTTDTGNVAVDLKVIDIFVPITKDSAQKGFAVNEDFPLANNSGQGCQVTIHMESNDGTAYWLAIGR